MHWNQIHDLGVANAKLYSLRNRNNSLDKIGLIELEIRIGDLDVGP